MPNFRIFIIVTVLLLMPMMSNALSIQGSLSRDFIVTPGSSTEAQIIVKNPSNEPKGIKIYQTDLKTWADGRNDYANINTYPRSNASWIKFSPDLLTVPAGGTGIINVTILAPNGNFEGSYWSMLMAEPLDEQSPELAGKGKGNGGIQFVVKTRYGIHVHTVIKDTGKKKAKFINKELKIENDRKMFFVDVENTGSKMFRGKCQIELFDSKGKPAGKLADPSELRLYPESSGRFKFDVSKIAAGKYTALCVVDAEDDDIYGSRHQLIIP